MDAAAFDRLEERLDKLESENKLLKILSTGSLVLLALLSLALVFWPSWSKSGRPARTEHDSSLGQVVTADHVRTHGVSILDRRGEVVAGLSNDQNNVTSLWLFDRGKGGLSMIISADGTPSISLWDTRGKRKATFTVANERLDPILELANREGIPQVVLGTDWPNIYMWRVVDDKASQQISLIAGHGVSSPSIGMFLTLSDCRY